MEGISLTGLVQDLLDQARSNSSGRASHTVHGGHEHRLRQVVIALTEGNGLAEHESPPEATLHVLSGRVRLSTADEAWEGGAGDLCPIPAARHALAALADSAVLLTVRVADPT